MGNLRYRIILLILIGKKMITKRDIESMGFTHVKQIGYSQAFTGLKNGATCFISYMSIIGMYDLDNRRAVFTDYYYSTTTSHHRNKFIRDYAGIIDNERFNILLNKYSLND